MKSIYTLFTAIILSSLLTGCTIDKAWEVIKDSDNFYGYQRYLLETEYPPNFEEALEKYFVTRDAYMEKNNIVVGDCFSNCLRIETDSMGTLFFESDVVTIKELDSLCFNYILNEDEDIEKPQKYTIIDVDSTRRIMSKFFFDISLNPKTPNQLKKDVFASVSKTIRKYRNLLAREWYHTSFEDLIMNRQEFLNNSLYRRAVFYNFGMMYPPPPPPPPPVDWEEED